MRKAWENNYESTKKIQKIQTKGFVLVISYFCLSIVWILYSDLFVESIIKDDLVVNAIQTIKGLTFVTLTTIFIYVIIKYYSQLVINTNKAFEDSEGKRKELSVNNEKTKLYQLITDYLTGEYNSSQEIIIQIFNYLFERVEASDQGSVYVVGDETIKFIDCRVYDLNRLNQLAFSSNQIELYSFSISRNNKPEKHLERILGPKNYKMYAETNPAIHESVYIGVVDVENQRFGISLDISEDRYKETHASYSEEVIKELKDVQFLMMTMFRIKNMVGMKNLVQSDLVNAFVATLDFHEDYAKGHSEEVAKISLGIGKELQLLESELDDLHWAAMIHDLGKIVIPKDILNKSSALSDEEYELVKQHSINGEVFLKSSESLKSISKYVRYHHERYDGKGYPDGLKGEEIPLIARIIALADAYHAMTSERPYKMALTDNQALQEIIDNDGSQFCPLVVEAFLKMKDK